MKQQNIIKQMVCINNKDYEDCMSIGQLYDVEIEDLENGDKMYKFIDNNKEPLQSMINRFTDFKGNINSKAIEIVNSMITELGASQEPFSGCESNYSEVQDKIDLLGEVIKKLTPKYYEIWFYYYGDNDERNSEEKAYTFYVKTDKELKTREELILELQRRFCRNEKRNVRGVNYIPVSDYFHLTNWFEINETDFQKSCGVQ